MEEERSLLQKQYCDYHSNNASEITEESLVKQSREFLILVKPEYRFILLNSDFYTNVLEKVAMKLEGKEESIQKIKSGFKSLEQYGVNLWKFPWRKEYHTIKLYTAFFKCNIEQQLQDTEAILDILKSLGYTVTGQQEVSNKEPNRELAIWMSLELFLVQVDLEMIKEIIDHFPESEFTLKDIVQVRSRTRDVEDAIAYLERKAAKRWKREEPRGDDAPSHRHTKNTHIGRIDTFNNVHSDSTTSNAEASAVQNTSRPLKLSRDDVAADMENSSTGSTVSRRQPSVGAPTEYKVPSGNTGGRYYPSINSEQFTDQDLYGVSPEGSQTYGVTQPSFDARHRTGPQAGSCYTSKQLNYDAPSESNQRNVDVRYSTVPVSGSRYEVDQRYQDPRYRTVPQTGPSDYSDNTEGSQHYHRVSHAGTPLYSDGTKDGMDSAMTTSRSVSHHETVTPLHPTHQYSTESSAGSLRDDDPRRHAVIIQSNTVLQSNKVISDTNGYQSKISSRTETRMHGFASGNARYANVQDISSYSGRKLGSNESDKRMSKKESARRHDDREAKYGQTGTSSVEPMEVEQTEYSRASRNDATSLYNGMAERAYGKTTVQLGVTDLNATLNQQLTLESNDRLAGKESKQVSGTSSEHRRQHGSESVAGAREATGSRAETIGKAQPTRSLYQLENNATTKEATRKSRSSAADLKDHNAVKIEPKDSSPGPSRRTSAQKDQTPGNSSKSDLHNKLSHDRSFEKGVKGVAVCELCALQGTIICRNCLRIVCRECVKIYETDLCEATKGNHEFVKLKDNKMPQKTSGDSKAYSGQESANINEGCADGETDWPCSRCTYLNPPEHRICVICGATRGVGIVESAKPGSRVCRNCTLNNEETATVCVACHKPLTKNETVV